MLKFFLLVLFSLSVGHFDRAFAGRNQSTLDCATYLVHGSHLAENVPLLRPLRLSSGHSLYFRLDAEDDHHWQFDIVQKTLNVQPKKLTVLLHGLGESHMSMLGIAEQLKANKRDVLLLELPYHGQQFFDLFLRDPAGHKLGALSYKDTLQDLSEAITRIALENNYQELELVGHSLGGGFMTFAIEQINQKIPVRDAFLISPYFEAIDRYHMREMASRMVLGGEHLVNMVNFMTPLAVKALMYDMTVRPYLQSQLPGHARRDLKFADLSDRERELLRLKTLVIEKTIKGSREMNASSIISTIPRSTRVHILHPKNDSLIPAQYHERMANQMRQAGLMVTYKTLEAGHMAVIEKPADIGMWILLNGD